MRAPNGYTRIALFGIASILALFAISSRSLAIVTAPPAAPARTPSAEELAVVASAAMQDGHAHDHGAMLAAVPGGTGGASTTASAGSTPGGQPTATQAAVVASSAPLPSIGATATGPRSVAVDYGDRTRKRVSLTFDAGADVGFAADILDTLKQERVVASFGMTGSWAEQNPTLVKRMASEGHHLINHTWSHSSFTGFSTNSAPMSRAERWSELDRTEAIIQRIAGVSTLPYFRPPYGDMDASVLADVGARGYTMTAMWAVDSLGWNGLSAPRIVERTLRLTSPGAILIFHVGAQSQDAAALPAIIRGLRESGYEFVSVATLMGQ